MVSFAAHRTRTMHTHMTHSKRSVDRWKSFLSHIGACTGSSRLMFGLYRCVYYILSSTVTTLQGVALLAQSTLEAWYCSLSIASGFVVGFSPSCKTHAVRGLHDSLEGCSSVTPVGDSTRSNRMLVDQVWWSAGKFDITNARRTRKDGQLTVISYYVVPIL